MLLAAYGVLAAVHTVRRRLLGTAARALDPGVARGAVRTTVVALADLTPTVKGVVLQPALALPAGTAAPRLAFSAGQWVDVFFPQPGSAATGAAEPTFEPFVGGFSLADSPTAYRESGQLRLAVKASPHRPASWIHDTCTVGSELWVRVGGQVFLDATSRNVLIIAGGVGISPLHGVFQEAVARKGLVSLLFSAQRTEELAFEARLLGAQAAAERAVVVKLFVTQQAATARPFTTSGRIGDADIAEQWARLTAQEAEYGPARVFVCGPPQMQDAMVERLQALGVQDDRICFERWW